MTGEEDARRPEAAPGRPARRRTWPWVLVGVALVGVLVLVGVGVFGLLDSLAGRGADEQAVYTEDGTLVEEPALAEGQAYGDNAELDALWDACDGGDGAACDELYVAAELGSEYETFGQYCGGRLPETEERPESCTEVAG